MSESHLPRALVLGSTSRYRHELLSRFQLPFETASPDVDETPQPGEAPAALALRLALAKAHAVAAQFPEAIVIGSDQVADLNGQPLGKPGTVEAACAQLAAMSGRRVDFHTAVCVARDEQLFQACDLTCVHFRTLDAAAVARYVAREQPLDCAGSFKCEGLGISLFEAIDNHDPTALVGLPRIATCRLLRQAGFVLP